MQELCLWLETIYFDKIGICNNVPLYLQKKSPAHLNIVHIRTKKRATQLNRQTDGATCFLKRRS